MISRVGIEDDFEVLAKLLRESFATVAKDFGLTIENCPTNNAFITNEELKSQLTDTREFYHLSLDGNKVGFIAVEPSSRDESVFYIEKVAVHADFRCKSIGRQMMDFATDRIMGLGGKKISIGVVDSNVKLKEWYQKQGFEEVSIKSFEHLPFDVCYMEKVLC